MSEKKVAASADEILALDDLPRELVYVPHWGRHVWMRAMTGAERDVWEVSLIQQKGDDPSANMRNLRARLVALCAITEDGERLFSDAQVGALGRKNAAALDVLYVAAERLSALTAAEVEELGKASASDPSDEAGSA